MKERPILFSGPMVRAIREERKTQTRRIIKPGAGQKWLTDETIQKVARWAPSNDEHGRPSPWWTMAVGHSRRIVHCGVEMDGGHIGSISCPYGQPGDRLWVRETWGLVRGGRWNSGCDDYDDVEFWSGPGVPKSKAGARGYSPTYRADWTDLEDTHFKPSIHMPRWASRITLEVTGVRVERLQEISEEDAKAEGINRGHSCDDPAVIGGGVETWHDCGDPGGWVTSPRASYRTLWDSINGAGSWAKNPWVWAISFRRVEQTSKESAA